MDTEFDITSTDTCASLSHFVQSQNLIDFFGKKLQLPFQLTLRESRINYSLHNLMVPVYLN